MHGRKGKHARETTPASEKKNISRRESETTASRKSLGVSLRKRMNTQGRWPWNRRARFSVGGGKGEKGRPEKRRTALIIRMKSLDRGKNYRPEENQRGKEIVRKKEKGKQGEITKGGENWNEN